MTRIIARSQRPLDAAYGPTYTFGAGSGAAVSPANAPAENLESIIDAIVETQRENNFLGCLLGRMALEKGDLNEAFRRRLDSSFGTLRQTLSGLLVEAGMEAEAADDYARFMLATIEGALLLTKAEADGRVLEGITGQLKSQVRRQLLAGVV